MFGSGDGGGREKQVSSRFEFIKNGETAEKIGRCKWPSSFNGSHVRSCPGCTYLFSILAPRVSNRVFSTKLVSLLPDSFEIAAGC